MVKVKNPVLLKCRLTVGEYVGHHLPSNVQDVSVVCQWCVGDFVWALLMQSNAKPSFSTLICNVVFGKLSLAV